MDKANEAKSTAKTSIQPKVYNEAGKIYIVTGCNTLNIYSRPSVESGTICQVDKGHEVVSDKGEENSDFVYVHVTNYLNGYAEKKFLKVK